MLAKAKNYLFLPLLALSLAACVANEVPESSSSILTSSNSSAESVASSSVIAQSSSSVQTSASSVIANVAPTVNFQTPSDSYSFDQGLNVVFITANAADEDGEVSSVSLYINNVLESKDLTAPFEWAPDTLNDLAAGSYQLRLVAEDNSGAIASSTVDITVNPTVNINPTLNFTNPEEGDVLPFNSSLDVTMTASDSDGSIASIILLLNNQNIAEITEAPYIWPANLLPQLQNLGQGQYILRAIVKDNRGGTAIKEISFEVLAQNDFPVVAFNAPASNLIMPVGSSLNVFAQAADADGTVENVVLSINGVEVGGDTAPPYEWKASANDELENLASGSYTLTLTATDDKGGVTKVSNVVEVSNSALESAGDPSWGKNQYQQFCITCHGSFGEGAATGPKLIPLKNSYTVNNQNYSLFKLIDDLMPADFPLSCQGQCARNVASYVNSSLPSRYAANVNLVGDAGTGKVEYTLHCESCHGPRGLGDSETKAVFPLKTGSNYRLTTYYAYSQVDLFAMIDVGMPIGTAGFPEGYAEACTGQCVADVIAYLKELEKTVTPAELLELKKVTGKAYYESLCLGCHGIDGSRFGIFPLTNDERTKTSLDNNDPLFVYNRDSMPLRDPSTCVGLCAEDVTVYIREVLAK